MSKIFENSFLKNGILELRSKALIISILIYSSNDKIRQLLDKITRIMNYILQLNFDDERCLQKHYNKN